MGPFWEEPERDNAPMKYKHCESKQPFRQEFRAGIQGSNKLQRQKIFQLQVDFSRKCTGSQNE